MSRPPRLLRIEATERQINAPVCERQELASVEAARIVAEVS